MQKEQILSSLNIRGFYKGLVPSIKEKANGEAIALCPFHNDHHPSLSINLENGLFNCFACNAKGDLFTFYQNLKKVDFKIAIKEIADIAGVTEPKPEVVATFDYKNAKGETLYIKQRIEPGYNSKPKSFVFKHRVDGKLIKGRGCEAVLYNLTEVARSKYSIIVEGEQKVELLRKWNLVAVCNDSGGGNWDSKYTQYFEGKKVVILPDNDLTGRNHARDIAKSLFEKATEIKIVELPELDEKHDVVDWKNKGGTREKLIELIKSTPLWEPEKEPELITQIPTLSDIYDLDIKVEWTLEKLIPQESITLLFGKGGIGKTWLMLQVGGCISEGRPFAGLSTQKTSTVYVDFENSLPVLHDRALILGRSNLYIWHESNKNISPPKLDKDEWILYKKLPQGSLLIFDTLRASQFLDENSSREMALIMDRLKKLRDIGFTIVLLHHTPKANENIYKGSTAILDLCDHVLGLERVKKDKNTPADEDDEDCLYRFGVRDKTRYEPQHIFLTFDPDVGFELAPDPDVENKKEILEIITRLHKETGTAPKKTDLVNIITNEIGLSKNKSRNMLRSGEGEYWRVTEGEKNASLYHPIQLSSFSPLYSMENWKTENENSTNSEKLSLEKSDNPIDNQEFTSLPDPSGQTEKQDDVLEVEEIVDEV